MQIQRSGKRATCALGFCGRSSSSRSRCRCSTSTSGTWTDRRCSVSGSRSSTKGCPLAATPSTPSSTCGAATRPTTTSHLQTVAWHHAMLPRPIRTMVGDLQMGAAHPTKRFHPLWWSSLPLPTPAPTPASVTSPSCSRCLTTRTTLLATLKHITSPRRLNQTATLHTRYRNGEFLA